MTMPIECVGAARIGLSIIIRKSIRALVILGAALLGSACQTFTGQPQRLEPVADELSDARNVALPAIVAAYNSATSDANRMYFRNEYIARRMYIIDLEYTEFETALTRERQEFGFGSAVTAQALSTAGAVFTPASTVRTLSGLASGVNATRGFYDSELLVNKTIQIVQSQMQSKRDDVATRIFGRLRESTMTYPLSAALHDIEEYYRAGTLTSGLIKATAEAGIDAKASAAQKVAVIKDQAVNGAIRDINQPLAPQGRLIITGPTRLTSQEESLPPNVIREIQIALCLPSPTDDFGPINSRARVAMSQFFAGAGLDSAQMIRSDAMLNLLNAAVSKVKVRKKGTCASASFKDARAVGASLRK